MGEQPTINAHVIYEVAMEELAVAQRRIVELTALYKQTLAELEQLRQQLEKEE